MSKLLSTYKTMKLIAKDGQLFFIKDKLFTRTSLIGERTIYCRRYKLYPDTGNHTITVSDIVLSQEKINELLNWPGNKPLEEFRIVPVKGFKPEPVGIDLTLNIHLLKKSIPKPKFATLR
jgi:hypothetical protein